MDNYFTDEYQRQKVSAFHVDGLVGHVLIVCIDYYGFHERNLFIDSLKLTSGIKTYEFSEELPIDSEGYDHLIYCVDDFSNYEHYESTRHLTDESGIKKLIIWNPKLSVYSMPQRALDKTDWIIIRELEKRFLSDLPISKKREEWRGLADRYLKLSPKPPLIKPVDESAP
ncbi:hypothetical protein JK628_03065 [Shewanella sp. KX20019]|uniref:hypothetical protein n=1 Tax=Shewanella sp. KX20019 TaxID=2803864 RepID=UPI001925879D|nr:hypothetical protein [Shewanella sp. KX20019]QQX80871.1 hypothetical protein JK628_03065 [Shewanella sp. KX20019]